MTPLPESLKRSNHSRLHLESLLEFLRCLPVLSRVVQNLPDICIEDNHQGLDVPASSNFSQRIV